MPLDLSHPCPPAPATDLANEVLTRLRRIIRAVDMDSHRLEQAHGVTTPQLLVLTDLADHGDSSLGALARRIQLSPSTVVGIVDRLVERRCVRRERDADDRRRIQLSLTAEGRALLERAPRPLQAALRERFTALPGEQQQAILAALAQLTDLMGAQQVDAGPVLAVGPLIPPPEATR